VKCVGPVIPIPQTFDARTETKARPMLFHSKQVRFDEQ
jgi:hypothetical protein